MIRDCVTSIHGASAAPNATRCAKVGETADYADVTDKKYENVWLGRSSVFKTAYRLISLAALRVRNSNIAPEKVSIELRIYNRRKETHAETRRRGEM
jgi:hypothetical protein